MQPFDSPSTADRPREYSLFVNQLFLVTIYHPLEPDSISSQNSAFSSVVPTWILLGASGDHVSKSMKLDM